MRERVSRIVADHLGPLIHGPFMDARTTLEERRRISNRVTKWRRLAWAHGIDTSEFEGLLRVHLAPKDVDALEKELRVVTRRMQSLHQRAATRAQATTREAALSLLAQRRDALTQQLDALEAA